MFTGIHTSHAGSWQSLAIVGWNAAQTFSRENLLAPALLCCSARRKPYAVAAMPGFCTHRNCMP